MTLLFSRRALAAQHQARAKEVQSQTRSMHSVLTVGRKALEVRECRYIVQSIYTYALVYRIVYHIRDVIVLLNAFCRISNITSHQYVNGS